MTELILTSPAKINLFLHITGQREDGYHNLQTLFQLLDYGDEMRFEPRSEGQIKLATPVAGVALEDNLIYRAAQLLKAKAANHHGVTIAIEKKLPMGGGLGGGSSNAATTLLALNQLWGLKLGIKQLAALGAQLGADVPVFIEGNTAWAEGVGEILSPVEMPNLWYLVLIPDCEVNTAEIFRHPELTRDTHPIKIRAFLEQGGRNDCQRVAQMLHPEVAEACQWLSQFQPARLTGTGACVFASFDDKTQAEQVLQKLPVKWRGFVAKGVNQSPTHKMLDL